MKTRKPVTFFEGLLVALIGSVFGSVAYFSFSSVLSDQIAVKLLITVLSFLYIIYLLRRSEQSIGRFIVILLWSVITIAVWLTYPSTAVYLLAQLLTVWIVRSIYFYSSLISTTADLLLILTSVASALWAINQSGSLFLTLWCFFLTQALFVFIPVRISPQTKRKTLHITREVNFQRSYRAAEAAVIKLSKQH